jgi:hypothetical protein
MQSQVKERKFVSVWLKRARKELAVSGRLEEVAHLLSGPDVGMRVMALRDWRSDLQRLRMGEWEPSMEDLMKIDAILSRPKQDRVTAGAASEELFLFS